MTVAPAPGLGTAIRRRRQERGLSQPQLAEKLGMTAAHADRPRPRRPPTAPVQAPRRARAADHPHRPGGSVITHRCKACQTPAEVGRVDATTTQGGPRFLWGRWERCTGCGSTAQPAELIDANSERLGRGQWGEA